MEDDRVAILEAQLAQAKLIAEEADKKYEEVEISNLTKQISNWLGRCVFGFRRPNFLVLCQFENAPKLGPVRFRFKRNFQNVLL